MSEKLEFYAVSAATLAIAYFHWFWPREQLGQAVAQIREPCVNASIQREKISDHPNCVGFTKMQQKRIRLWLYLSQTGCSQARMCILFLFGRMLIHLGTV